MPATSTCMTTENNHCNCRCFCFDLLSQNESNLYSYSYLVTQLVIPTTALVTDDDLVVCLRLRLLADDTQQVRLWQCQLSEIFKWGPTLGVISKLDQALFSDQVHLQQYTNRMYRTSATEYKLVILSTLKVQVKVRTSTIFLTKPKCQMTVRWLQPLYYGFCYAGTLWCEVGNLMHRNI